MADSIRRKFLAGALLAPVLGTVLTWRKAWGGPSTATLIPLLRSRLRETLANPDWAREVGRHYLALHPEDADLQRLTEGLLVPESLQDKAAFAGRIGALRVRDFASDDTVCVDGWVLARVEARICALVGRV